MKARIGLLLMGLAIMAGLVGCSGDDDDSGCPSGTLSAEVAISGTPTGSLPDSASYSCASAFAVTGTISFLFGDAGDESVLGLVVPNGATGSLVIDSAGAATTNVSWSQSLTEVNSAAQCLAPTGTLASNGTITVSTTPTLTAGAGSFSIPSLCDDAGAVVYTNVTGDFEIP